MLLLLLSLLLASCLVVLATKPISNNNNLQSTLEFFRPTAQQNAVHECRRDASKASRHLQSLIKMIPALSEHDKLMALEAAMPALKLYPNQDKIILLVLTLLSLLTRDTSQSLLERISNDLQFIIDTLNSSLSRAKAIDEPFERDERLSAEIQRRGCLFLGGLAENDDAARHMIEVGGLDCIIDSLSWYRFHSGVCKWGLWAVFHLCYDRPDRHTYFVQKNGIQITCKCITNDNNISVEVTRHGIAILFDIMRGNGETATKAKAIAFQEGLHDLLLNSIDSYPEDTEICMMSQQILGGATTTFTLSNLVGE